MRLHQMIKRYKNYKLKRKRLQMLRNLKKHKSFKMILKRYNKNKNN
jgi:hypothetical protein